MSGLIEWRKVLGHKTKTAHKACTPATYAGAEKAERLGTTCARFSGLVLNDGTPLVAVRFKSLFSPAVPRRKRAGQAVGRWATGEPNA